MKFLSWKGSSLKLSSHKRALDTWRQNRPPVYRASKQKKKKIEGKNEEKKNRIESTDQVKHVTVKGAITHVFRTKLLQATFTAKTNKLSSIFVH
jgi:hypothetical protein